MPGNKNNESKKASKSASYGTIAIIGGGIAGCTTAIELAKQGYDVKILEQDSDILH